MKKSLWLFISMLVLILASCAKEKNETVEEVQDRLLRAYINVVHLDTLDRSEMGYYMIEQKKGTGATPKTKDWVKWEQTQRSLDETIIGTTEKNTAILVGLYNENLQTTHYIPNYAYLEKGHLAVIFEDAFKKMKVGGEYRLILPARLLSNTLNGKTNTGANCILDINLKEIIEKPETYEQNQVLAYRDANYPGLDSLKKNMFFQSTDIAPDVVKDPITDTIISIKDTTGVKKDKVVQIYYVGKFLDGFVFDTNIVDTAKAHNRYIQAVTDKDKEQEKKKYAPLEFKIGNNDLIPGFEEAVKQLKTGDKGIVFFTSQWGYGAHGQTPTKEEERKATIIQPYTPLMFEITLHKILK